MDLDALCDLGPSIYDNSTGSWDLEYDIPSSVRRALGEWARTNSPVAHWYTVLLAYTHISDQDLGMKKGF